MNYHCLNILAENFAKDLEMIVNEDCVIFKYLCDNEPKEDIINYLDIDSISLYKSDSGYGLEIESNNTMFELTIELDDLDKRRKCEIIYQNILPIMRKKHNEESLDIQFNKDDQGRLSDFCIKEKSSGNRFKKIMSFIVFILVVMLITKL